MPQLISIAAQTSPKFDTIIASPFDLGNIQDAFMYYHYGIAEKGQEPAEKSIHSYLKRAKNTISIEEPIINELSETYSLLENFYSSSSGSIENINDTTIFDGISSSVQNINSTLENYNLVFDRALRVIYESFNLKNSSYTLQLNDNNKIVVVQSEIITNIIVPNDGEANFPPGSNLEIINIGGNSVNIVGNSGVNLRGDQKTLEKTTSKSNQSKAIYKRASNDWVVIQ
jgi:hypothetical protein